MTSSRVTLVALLGLLAPCADAVAQRGRADVREGNRLYAEQRFEEARQRYLEALREAPDAPVVRFNEGNALYQTEEYERAMDAYRQALERGDPALQEQAWYNLGNALFRQQQFPEAMEAYKEALRLDPGDVDAKHNLELVLERMQQQQQQQQQQPQQQQEQQEGDEGSQPQQQPGEGAEGSDRQPPGDDQSREREQQEEGNRPEDRGGDQGMPPQEESGPGEPQPQPGQMSREEAERLLQAIDEDPGELRRQRADGRPATRVVKKW